MAADYAGACAAIVQKFKDAWGNTTPVDTANSSGFTPPADGSGAPLPWAMFEIISAGSAKRGIGKPGASVVIYSGLIKATIFVPAGDGTANGLAFAVQAGEIFRDQLFYDDVTPGCYVRSGYDMNGQPRITDGDAKSEDGQEFAVTATIPFEYWHRA